MKKLSLLFAALLTATVMNLQAAEPAPCEGLNPHKPYLENFESYGATVTSALASTKGYEISPSWWKNAKTPTCWTVGNEKLGTDTSKCTSSNRSYFPYIFSNGVVTVNTTTGVADKTKYYDKSLNSSKYAPEGCNALKMATSSAYGIVWAAMPELTVEDISSLVISASARFSKATTSIPHALIVGIMEDPTDLSTFVVLDSIATGAGTTASNPAQKIEVSVIEKGYSGKGRYVAFRTAYNPNAASTAYKVCATTVYLDSIALRVEPFYAQNNWETESDWSWKQMVRMSDSICRMDSVVFGGLGINFNDTADTPDATWVAASDFKGDAVQAKDTVSFTYNTSTKEVTMTLVGRPAAPEPPACKDSVENKTICYGESIMWRGKTCNETKAYHDTLRYEGTQYDSVHFTLNLKVTAEAIENIENKTICYGESVMWRGKTCNETKAYHDTLRYDGTQCDSVHFTFNLKVTAECKENIENKTICYGESVMWRGKTCNETKAYYDTLRYDGTQCDSVHFTLNLKVTAEAKEIVENKTIGYGESVMWRGKTCNETKAYCDTLRYDGTQCDSVHFTLNLTVLPKAYTRNVTNGNFGTICLAKAFSAADGVEGLYKPATQATDSSVLYCTEVLLSEVVAGESYIFKADSDAVVFTLAGTTIADPVVANNMLGNLGDTITVDANFIAEHSGYAILGTPAGASEQQVVKLVEDSKLLPNCAMINLKTVPATGAPQAAPDRRMISFGRNVATGMEQVAGGRLQVAEKCMVNGQLVIIRDGKMFNAQGQEL